MPSRALEAPAAPAHKLHAGGARERLLDAALAHFAADGGLGATLEDIRRDAGVSVGALYHHFSDKAALAGALYGTLTDEFQQGFLEELRANAGAEIHGVVARARGGRRRQQDGVMADAMAA